MWKKKIPVTKCYPSEYWTTGPLILSPTCSSHYCHSCTFRKKLYCTILSHTLEEPHHVGEFGMSPLRCAEMSVPIPFIARLAGLNQDFSLLKSDVSPAFGQMFFPLPPKQTFEAEISGLSSDHSDHYPCEHLFYKVICEFTTWVVGSIYEW